MTNFRTAEKALARLQWLDMRAGDDIRDYSHAGAATDRTRIAVDRARMTGTEAGDAAISKAQRAEATALETMVPEPGTEQHREQSQWSKDRKEAVARLEAAGIASGVYGGWTNLYAGRHLLDIIRSIAPMRGDLAGTRLAHMTERVAEQRAELARCGIEI